MKRSQLSVLAITLAGLAAGQAIAADTSTVTREQVRAELAQAVRAGDIVANNETGERLNAQQPGRYVGASVGTAKSRAEVSAELAAATRAGWVVVDNQTGLMLKDLQPARGSQTAGSVTREQVKAELAEAIRNGDVVVNNATGEKLNALVPGFDKRDRRA